jgi:microcompartment protein CcmK/EutM
MKLGRVVGTVVSTIKASGLNSCKLLIISPLDARVSDPSAGDADTYVAVDLVGAGEGEVVLVSFGSAARVARDAGQTPTDAAIIAVVDTVQFGVRTAYSKS